MTANTISIPPQTAMSVRNISPPTGMNAVRAVATRDRYAQKAIPITAETINRMPAIIGIFVWGFAVGGYIGAVPGGP